ncbi:MAG TPA: hypothetical protein VFV83_07270, partial [Chthoniobacteraceae bacterium]|nr:hypothetical protein [Chthoniobacteraceae bacterium]
MSATAATAAGWLTLLKLLLLLALNLDLALLLCGPLRFERPKLLLLLLLVRTLLLHLTLRIDLPLAQCPLTQGIRLLLRLLLALPADIVVIIIALTRPLLRLLLLWLDDRRTLSFAPLFFLRVFGFLLPARTGGGEFRLV